MSSGSSAYLACFGEKASLIALAAVVWQSDKLLQIDNHVSGGKRAQKVLNCSLSLSLSLSLTHSLSPSFSLSLLHSLSVCGRSLAATGEALNCCVYPQRLDKQRKAAGH